MMATAARTTSAKPPPLPSSPGASSSPRTPPNLRNFSGAFNSPSLSGQSSFRTDDEILVYSLDSRSLLSGFGGEAIPRSQIQFSPELQERSGDLDRHLLARHEYLHSRRRVPEAEEEEAGIKAWGKAYELYAPDLRGLDLGLLGDTLGRAIRSAHVEDGLVQDDSKKRSVILIVSSALSQPLLETTLETCFKLYPNPVNITLLSSSIATIIAAGLRNALVVDIGWHEITVTGVYEYREVRTECSERAGKRLSWEFAQLLQHYLPEAEQRRGLALEDVEEVVHRIAWCHPASRRQQPDTNHDDTSVEITLPSQPPDSPISVPFAHLSLPAESTFFSSPSSQTPEHQTTQPTPPSTPPLDDNLLPLPRLLHQTLLNLPPDIRATLYSRIIFTGPSTRIPGLKSRTLRELAYLIRTQGWDKVSNYGHARSKWRGINVEISGLDPPSTSPPAPSSEPPPPLSSRSSLPPSPTTPSQTEPPFLPASQRQQEADHILAHLRKTSPEALTTHTPREKIVLRAVRSLGPWVGASLLSGLKVRGTVEIEREAFLANGLSGMESGKRRSREQREAAFRTGSPEKRVTSGRPVSPEKRTVSGRTGSPEKKSLGGRQSLLGAGGMGGTGASSTGGGGLGVWGLER